MMIPAMGGDPVLPVVAGLVARWRGDLEYITLNGSDVSGHADRAKSHNLSQDTAASQPEYNNTPIGGRPTVFYNANKFMTTPDATDLDMGQLTFLTLMVMRRPALAAFFVAWAKGTNSSADNLRGFINSTNKMQLFWGSNAQSYSASALAIPDDVPCMIGWGIDAVSSEVIYVLNDTVERISVTLSGTGANAMPWRFHGDGNILAYDNDPWHMGEALVYKRDGSTAWTDAEIKGIYNNYAQPYYDL